MTCLDCIFNDVKEINVFLKVIILDYFSWLYLRWSVPCIYLHATRELP